MSKKDYCDAVNEIEIREELKRETKEKAINVKTKRTYNKIYPLASLAIMCAVLMGIVLPHKSIAPIENPKIETTENEQTEVVSALPKVENFENFYEMLRDREDNYRYFNTMIDLAVMEDATVATNETKQQDNFSTTNVQVEGVDEADIVKTDGEYIYYVSSNKLTITDVSDSTKMSSASEIEFNDEDFDAQEMFLKDDKVVVIGTKYSNYRVVENKAETDYPTYTSYTIASTYNVEDKTDPELERTVEVEGSYLSSRMIGDDVYLVANKGIYTYLIKNSSCDELEEDYFKPKYVDTAVGEEVKYIDYDCIYYIPEFEDSSYLNIASFNIINEEPASIESYLGAGSEIYASNTNLYVTKGKYNYEEDYDVNTDIYKFNLKDATCTFEKSGTVPGYVLNQFSMDEKDGYFRIATTDSTSWDSEDNTNNLYVLNENMEIVGKIEGLAPGEKIYSVRFMGDRAYMVTFVQTDPLYVIDLSNPTNPTVLGELKIPGYSKYLHPYDETHLIGIGEDTKVVNYGYGDQVVTDGMKMALFDVTDPNNPVEMYNVKIGEKGTYSEILNNHKALLFSKEKNIIAFPISITENDYNVTFQGAIVYGISLDKGFELKTKISNSQSDMDKYYGRSTVQRIIYIGDTLYTLSSNLIKATDMSTMETKGSISL